jgi:hypothetical protein
MPVRPIIPTTRRERVANYGDAQRVTGPNLATLFHWSAEQSWQIVLYVQCEEFVIPAPAIGTADFRPFVRISWGHGASSNETDVEVTYRQRIPLVCSTLHVQCFIASLPLAQSNGTTVEAPVPVGAAARFRGFMGEGVDGVPLFPTQWVTQMGTGAGQIRAGQTRLSSFRAFLPVATASPRYLLLLDQNAPPANGQIPVDGFPLVVPPNQSSPPGLPLGQTRGFVQGLAWAVSSTPFVVTLDPAAQAFVCAELFE